MTFFIIIIIIIILFILANISIPQNNCDCHKEATPYIHTEQDIYERQLRESEVKRLEYIRELDRREKNYKESTKAIENNIDLVMSYFSVFDINYICEGIPIEELSINKEFCYLKRFYSKNGGILFFLSKAGKIGLDNLFMVDRRHRKAYQVSAELKDKASFEKLFGDFFLRAKSSDIRASWLEYLKRNNIEEKSLYKDGTEGIPKYVVRKGTSPAKKYKRYIRKRRI